MMPELKSKGFPSIQQIAYQCGVSCEDATFTMHGHEAFTHLTHIERKYCLSDFLAMT